MVWVDSVVKASGGKTALYQPYPYVMHSSDEGPTQFSKNYFDLKFFDRKQQEEFDSVIARSGLREKAVEVIPGIYSSDSQVKSPPLVGPKGQVDSAKVQLDKIAKKVGSNVLPIGYLMELCRVKHPEYYLYVGPSPSKAGKYLIACSAYKYLTGKSPKNIAYNPGLPPEEAQTIRTLVDDAQF